MNFPEAPAFIIIGAQKAGSSALADNLKLHPSIVGSIAQRDKELHFLDWMIPDKNARDELQATMNYSMEELWCSYRLKYASSFDMDLLRRNASLVAFEKTPSYMFHSYSLPEILRSVCPWNPKLLAILRDPIDRSWSQYNMAMSAKQLISLGDRFVFNSTTFPTFEDLLEREIISLRRWQLSNAPLLSDPITKWDKNHFLLPKMNNTNLDDAHKKHFRNVFLANYLQRGMYAVQLQRWKEAFGNHLLVIRYEDLYGPNSQDYYNQIVDHIGVPRVPFPLSNNKHWSRRKYKIAMSNRTKQYLRLFFQPYNEMLADLLGSSWENPWGS